MSTASILVIFAFLLTASRGSDFLKRELPQEKLCRFGNNYLPEEIFESFAGWRCYEEVFKNLRRVTVYVCTSNTRGRSYKIPCLKTQNQMISFDLENSEIITEISKNLDSTELTDQLVECYFGSVSACEAEGDPLGTDPRVWAPNSNWHLCDTLSRSKFHVAILSISLIFGIPALALLTYYCWTTNTIMLSYHRNLLAALVFRTFFTLLIQTEVFWRMADSLTVLKDNGAGCKALASLETLCLNLVLSFWFMEVLYLHRHAKRSFSEEPEVNMYNYGTGGTSILFWIVWMIVMSSAHDTHCWLGDRNWTQWINDPLRIIYLVAHFGLTCDLIRMLLTTLKAVHDDTARILRRNSLVMFLLLPLFFLQFALNAGQPEDTDCNDAYYYTLYFIDGIQLAIVSLVVAYFNQQVQTLIKTDFGITSESKDSHSFIKGNLERSITTIDAVQERPIKKPEEEEDDRKDVTYSSVVRPAQYERYLGLYSRVGAVPQLSVTLCDGDAYLDCNTNAVNRKASQMTEYYDASEKDGESLSEYHDVLASQMSLNVFHDPKDFVEPEKIQTNLLVASAPKPPAKVENKDRPEPMYQSKYLVQDSETSSSDSEDSVIENSAKEFLEVDLTKTDEPISMKRNESAATLVDSEAGRSNLSLGKELLDTLEYDNRQIIQDWVKESQDTTFPQVSPPVSRITTEDDDVDAESLNATEISNTESDIAKAETTESPPSTIEMQQDDKNLLEGGTIDEGYIEFENKLYKGDEDGYYPLEDFEFPEPKWMTALGVIQNDVSETGSETEGAVADLRNEGLTSDSEDPELSNSEFQSEKRNYKKSSSDSDSEFEIEKVNHAKINDSHSKSEDVDNRYSIRSLKMLDEYYDKLNEFKKSDQTEAPTSSSPSSSSDEEPEERINQYYQTLSQSIRPKLGYKIDKSSLGLSPESNLSPRTSDGDEDRTPVQDYKFYDQCFPALVAKEASSDPRGAGDDSNENLLVRLGESGFEREGVRDKEERGKDEYISSSSDSDGSVKITARPVQVVHEINDWEPQKLSY